MKLVLVDEHATTGSLWARSGLIRVILQDGFLAEYSEYPFSGDTRAVCVPVRIVFETGRKDIGLLEVLEQGVTGEIDTRSKGIEPFERLVHIRPEQRVTAFFPVSR